MATLTEAAAPTLTYEAYMAEPETQGRYDIVNGVRVFQPGATWDHRRICWQCVRGYCADYERASGGDIVPSPFDVLIRREPNCKPGSRTCCSSAIARSHWQAAGPPKGPLEIAPELVVEIISDSETQRILGDKIADYVSIGVDECWVVRPDERTVEVLATDAERGAERGGLWGAGRQLRRSSFLTLSVPVADIFAP